MQLSYNIYFLAKNLGDNYLESPQAYSRLCNGSFNHIVYYFWILKNNLKDSRYNFFLVKDLPNNIKKDDIVFFYYDTKDKVDFSRCITVQAVGDKPIVALSKYYITHNKSMISEDTFYIHLPLPVCLKKMSPSFPPKNFVGVGAKHSFNKEIISPIFKKQCSFLDINFEIICDKNYPDIDTDVFIFLRDKNLPHYLKDDGTFLHPSAVWSPFYGATHRHANRLYQAWYMNTPLIHNREASIESAVTDKYDLLYAETPRELITQMLFLKNNKEYYLKMVEHYKSKQNLNSYDIIVSQFLDLFKKICTQ